MSKKTLKEKKKWSKKGICWKCEKKQIKRPNFLCEECISNKNFCKNSIKSCKII